MRLIVGDRRCDGRFCLCRGCSFGWGMSWEESMRLIVGDRRWGAASVCFGVFGAVWGFVCRLRLCMGLHRPLRWLFGRPLWLGLVCGTQLCLQAALPCCPANSPNRACRRACKPLCATFAPQARRSEDAGQEEAAGFLAAPFFGTNCTACLIAPQVWRSEDSGREEDGVQRVCPGTQEGRGGGGAPAAHEGGCSPCCAVRAARSTTRSTTRQLPGPHASWCRPWMGFMQQLRGTACRFVLWPSARVPINNFSLAGQGGLLCPAGRLRGAAC